MPLFAVEGSSEGRSSRRTRRYALSFSAGLGANIAMGLEDGVEGTIARLLAATAHQPLTSGDPPADARALETLVRVDPSADAGGKCAICLEDLGTLHDDTNCLGYVAANDSMELETMPCTRPKLR